MDRRPSNVMESRDRKQGSHDERVQRSSLEADALLNKIAEELNDELCHNLHSKLQLPRVRFLIFFHPLCLRRHK